MFTSNIVIFVINYCCRCTLLLLFYRVYFISLNFLVLVSSVSKNSPRDKRA